MCAHTGTRSTRQACAVASEVGGGGGAHLNARLARREPRQQHGLQQVAHCVQLSAHELRLLSDEHEAQLAVHGAHGASAALQKLD